MARLYDRVVGGFDRAHDLITPRGRHEMKQAPVLVVDNVAEYLYAVNSKEMWDIRCDFPNLAPPFPYFWMETRRPSKIVSDLLGDRSSDSLPRAWGALFSVNENPDPHAFDDWRWSICTMMALAGVTDRQPPRLIGGFSFKVAGGGQVSDDSKQMAWTAGECPDDQREGVGAEITALMYTFLLAISFMHCRNVARVPVCQPPKLSKKWERKHGRPLVRYHVLDIDPMKQTLESEGEVSEHGLKKALHICRGHFATYTSGAPLFGNYVGTVWKPQHVRGSAQEGIVVKDYQVLAP